MKPTPGQPYTAKTGDTFESISIQAYGEPSQSTAIQAVSPTQYNLTVTDQIPAGTIVIIPINNVNKQLRQAQLERGLNGG